MMLVGLASCSISLNSPPIPLPSSTQQSRLYFNLLNLPEGQPDLILICNLDRSNIFPHLSTVLLALLPALATIQLTIPFSLMFLALFLETFAQLWLMFHTKVPFFDSFVRILTLFLTFSTLQFVSKHFTIFFKLSLKLFWKYCLDISKNGCGTSVYSTNRS